MEQRLDRAVQFRLSKSGYQSRDQDKTDVGEMAGKGTWGERVPLRGICDGCKAKSAQLLAKSSGLVGGCVLSSVHSPI